MTQKPLYPLYLGKRIADLNEHCDLDPNISQWEFRDVIKTANELLESGKKEVSDRDEEMAYIHFVRFSRFYDELQRRENALRANELPTDMFPIHIIMEEVEILHKSLYKRYNELAISEGIEATNVGAEVSASPPADKDDVNPPAVKVDASPPKAPQQPIMISCNFLYTLMKEKRTNLLIMDCRPEAEFGSSRLIYRNYVNVPEKVIRHGLPAGDFNALLNANDLEKWMSAWENDYVILLDRSTQKQNFKNSPVEKLRKIVLKDPITKYDFPQIYMVDGGFQQFKRMYPEWVVSLIDIKDE